MKLLLFSQAPETNFTEIFEEFFGSVNSAKLAYIPNARDLSISEKRRRATDNRETIEKLGFDVEEIDLLKVRGSELLDKLSSKDIIWMNGGFVSNLIEASEVSGLKENIRKLLDSGLKYIGSSAGSMVASENLDAAAWYPGENDTKAKNLSGFGLVDFQIIPHYIPEYLKEVKINAKPGETYYLLRDDQVIGVNNNELNFFGDKPEVYKK